MSLASIYRKRFIKANLRLSMRELAEAAEVSPSQLRYWERKGYIHSEQTQENSSHKYQLATLFQVMGIKYYLDEGYTLPVAVAKEDERRSQMKDFQRFIVDRVFEIEATKEGTRIDLGPLEDDPKKSVEAIVKEDDHVELRLFDTK